MSQNATSNNHEICVLIPAATSAKWLPWWVKFKSKACSSGASTLLYVCCKHVCIGPIFETPDLVITVSWEQYIRPQAVVDKIVTNNNRVLHVNRKSCFSFTHRVRPTPQDRKCSTFRLVKVSLQDIKISDTSGQQMWHTSSPWTQKD